MSRLETVGADALCRRSQTQEQIDSIIGSINYLHDQIEVLINVLDPLLRPVENKKNPNADQLQPVCYVVPHAERLRSMASDVASAADKITSVLERIEL
jgi:hypothetical protein